MKRNICFLTAVLLLAGCATSPEPDYFALAPASGPIVQDVTYVVKIQRPFLAGYLDRPDIVWQNNAYQVQIDESNRWAEPLDTMFERVLAQDLRQRLPHATIVTQDDGGSYTARVTIAIDIQQFNKTAQGNAALQAQLHMKDTGVHEQPRPEPMHYSTDTGSSASSIAQSLSTLTGDMADGIAVMLHNQQVRGEKTTPHAPEHATDD